MVRYYINGKEITRVQAIKQNKRNEKYLELARKNFKDVNKWQEYMNKCKFVFIVYDKSEKREITSSTYKRSQKRLDKEVASFMGVR